MRQDPIQNFRYLVEIDKITNAGFCEVIMPSAVTETITYREGADPSHVRKLNGLTVYGNILLKRGITANKELYDWFKAVMDSGAPGNRRSMSIQLTDEEGNEKARWNIFEAWPVSYKVSDLNAQANEVAVEILEITFESFTRES